MRQRQYQKKKKRRRPSQKNSNKKRCRQCGGFLNGYGFAYPGHDTVNQAAKVSPGVIKATGNNTNTIATDRTFFTQGGKEMERVLPKNIKESHQEHLSKPIQTFRWFWKTTI